VGEQLVGLIMKLERSMFTWIERMRIGIPPMIDGTVSEIAVTWASVWSTPMATRTAVTTRREVPIHNGLVTIA
jgi:hypothetical protein